MINWSQFTELAPHIARVFVRRHRAAGQLCLLGTLRPDGIPRISPMEPRIAADELWLSGIPQTAKFADLDRDPRFSLHTATTDSAVTDGDAKVWGTAVKIRDSRKLAALADTLYAETGIDTRADNPDFGYAVDLSGGSAVEPIDEQLALVTWAPDRHERITRHL